HLSVGTAPASWSTQQPKVAPPPPLLKGKLLRSVWRRRRRKPRTYPPSALWPQPRRCQMRDWSQTSRASAWTPAVTKTRAKIKES
ncbi:hypothetical protein J4Q44_G00393010, partial [Coregonus suidteri]